MCIRDSDKVDQMLSSGKVSVNDADYAGRTPLHVAASRGHLELVTLLVDDHGANHRVRCAPSHPYHTSFTYQENTYMEGKHSRACNAPRHELFLTACTDNSLAVMYPAERAVDKVYGGAGIAREASPSMTRSATASATLSISLSHAAASSLCRRRTTSHRFCRRLQAMMLIWCRC